MQDILLGSLAGIALGASLLVITAKNPVRAVLSLILTFCATAGIWLMLQAEFLAIALILVYVGAVMVLFLFVVMMLDIDFAILKARFTKWLPIGLGLAIALLVLLLSIIDRDHFTFRDNITDLAYGGTYGQTTSNVSMLGTLIFTKYLLQFEIAGVLLLVAIIAAIGLIYKGPRNRKTQNISNQIQVKRNDRVRLVEGD